MLFCWRWVMTQNNRERQCRVKDTSLHQTFHLPPKEVVPPSDNVKRHVSKGAPFQLKCLRFPMNQRMLQCRVIMSISPVVTLHINRQRHFILPTSHTNHTQNLCIHSSSSSSHSYCSSSSSSSSFTLLRISSHSLHLNPKPTQNGRIT